MTLIERTELETLSADLAAGSTAVVVPIDTGNTVLVFAPGERQHMATLLKGAFEL